MPLITFSPNTQIPSADLNSNFAGLASGAFLANNAITGANAALVDTAGASFTGGRVGGTGNRWRLQVGLFQLGYAGYGYWNFPIPLADVAGAIIVAMIKGRDTGTYAYIRGQIENTTQAIFYISAAEQPFVFAMVWGQCAS